MLLLALILQSVAYSPWPDLPNPTSCWSGGRHYRLIRSASGIEGEPYRLSLRITQKGRRPKMILVDDDPGYYEQFAVCPRPGGVLIGSAAYRNVKFHTVDRTNRVWIVPLMLSSNEGIVGTCAQGIIFSQVPPDYRKEEFQKIKLLTLNAKSLDLNNFDRRLHGQRP